MSMKMLAGLAALAAMAACGRPPAALSMKEGELMTPVSTASKAPIPPIDLALPGRLETATFALG